MLAGRVERYTGLGLSNLLTGIYGDAWQLVDEASSPGVHGVQHGSLRHAWIGNMQLHPGALELQDALLHLG